jgi:cell division protein FtsB
MEQELEQLRTENASLKKRIRQLESQLAAAAAITNVDSTDEIVYNEKTPLTNGEIHRYGRQLILPNIGVAGN